MAEKRTAPDLAGMGAAKQQSSLREKYTMRNQGKPHQICVAQQASPPSCLSTNGHMDLHGMSVPLPIKYLIQHGNSIGQYPSDAAALAAVLSTLTAAGYDDDHIVRLCLLEEYGISELPRDRSPDWLRQELKRVRRQADTLTRQAKGEPEAGRDLLADRGRSPKAIVDGLLNEGMILFGGKPKRGKSWLMLDLALSVGIGSPVWRHFPVPEPQPVLYIGLEDGRDDIRERLFAIQPGITDTGKLEFLYSFPRLNEGGLEKMRSYAESGRYRLIIVDVLARVESADRRNGEKRYHDIYDMLAPLQDLRHQHPLCMILVTHLRKSEAQDIFDGLHGSVAYQGVQDALWVLERRLHSNIAVVHTLGKRSHHQALHVSFADGHWEFLGHDDEIKFSQARQDVQDLLDEYDRDMTISEVNRHLSQPRDRYRATQQLMYRMLQDGQLVRRGRGRYGLVRHPDGNRQLQGAKGNNETQGNAGAAFHFGD